MPEDARTVEVLLWWSPAARQVQEHRLALPAGATVLDALHAAGVFAQLSASELAAASLGVWGRKARNDLALRDGDRVELYRGLRVDPKVARRERFRSQGTRAAGLFAQRRAQGNTAD
jgi:uncharacterized protein